MRSFIGNGNKSSYSGRVWSLDSDDDEVCGAVFIVIVIVGDEIGR